MTDSEKELRRLAEEAERKRCGGYWPDDLRRLHSALWPKDVLALLDRIEALEKTVEIAEGNGLERAAQAVESAPASFNRNDHAERIRRMRRS